MPKSEVFGMRWQHPGRLSVATQLGSSGGNSFGFLEQIPSMDGIVSPLPVHVDHPEESLQDRFREHSTGWKVYAKFTAFRRMINRWNWSRQVIPRHDLNPPFRGAVLQRRGITIRLFPSLPRVT
jgi:hypothetical protein